jgi:adenine-specific DNA-methyltransferase
MSGHLADGERALGYIGSKLKLLPWIRSTVVAEWGELREWTLADLFAGTGAVTAGLIDLFKDGVTNDCERYSELVCIARFLPPEILPDWSAIQPLDGYVTREYCTQRSFFSPANGRVIDGFREWAKQQPSGLSRDYALGCMLVAADRKNNTTGVYGAFLKHLCGRALTPINIKHLGGSAPVRIMRGDAAEAAATVPSTTVLYLDPPYTSRPYGNNYFVLNVLGDPDSEPELKGVTGIPVTGWQRSAWNSRAGSMASLKELLHGSQARRCVMSYSTDGLMSVADVKKVFKVTGWRVRVETAQYNRYENNNKGVAKRQKKQLKEILFVCNKL